KRRTALPRRTAGPRRSAVVLPPVVNMFERADAASPVVSQAILGACVAVLDSSRGFDLVETPDRYRGWISSAALRPLGPRAAAPGRRRRRRYGAALPGATVPVGRDEPVRSRLLGARAARVPPARLPFAARRRSAVRRPEPARGGRRGPRDRRPGVLRTR